MNKKKNIKWLRYFAFLAILSLFAFSGCFGIFDSSSKKRRIEVLEYKVDELGQQLQSIENYSKSMDKKIADLYKERDRINSEHKMTKNDISSMEITHKNTEENISKMKKAVVSTQKAIKKIYDKMLNIEEQQTEIEGEIKRISKSNARVESDSFDTEFDIVSDKKVVLDYMGTRVSKENERKDSVVTQKLNKAKKLSDQGMIDKAINMYEEMLISDPNLLEVYYNLGSLYYDQGMIDKSIKVYENLVTLNPGDVEAHSLLGVSYAKNDMIDEAIAELKKALEINPNLAEVHVGLSVAYLKKGMVDESIVENKRAIEIDSELAKAHKYLGIAYKRKGMNEEAKNEFNMYKELTNKGM